MHKTWGLDLQHHTTQTECGDDRICNPSPQDVETEGPGVKVLSVFISSVRNHTTEVVLITEISYKYVPGVGGRCTSLFIGSITRLKGNLMKAT